MNSLNSYSPPNKLILSLYTCRYTYCTLHVCRLCTDRLDLTLSICCIFLIILHIYMLFIKRALWVSLMICFYLIIPYFLVFLYLFSLSYLIFGCKMEEFHRSGKPLFDGAV